MACDLAGRSMARRLIRLPVHPKVSFAARCSGMIRAPQIVPETADPEHKMPAAPMVSPLMASRDARPPESRRGEYSPSSCCFKLAITILSDVRSRFDAASP